MNDFHYDGSTISLNRKNEIIVQKCTVSENSSFHTHSFIEIAYIASGSGVHEIEGGYSSKVGQGDLMLFNSNVAHAFKVEDNGI